MNTLNLFMFDEIRNDPRFTALERRIAAAANKAP